MVVNILNQKTIYKRLSWDKLSVYFSFDNVVSRFLTWYKALNHSNSKCKNPGSGNSKVDLKEELPWWQIVNLTHLLRITSKTISEKYIWCIHTKNNQLRCPLGFPFSLGFSNFQVLRLLDFLVPGLPRTEGRTEIK